MAEFPHLLEFKDLNQICNVLEQIVLHSIGPRGCSTLLSTETGKVIITNNGNSVLSRLHFSHPLANLVINSMSKTVSYTGDGSKTFILYLSEFIKELDNIKYRNHFSGRHSLIYALQKVKQELTENLFSFIRGKVPYTIQCFSSEITQSIIKTCLSNSFQIRIVDHFANLMNDMINCQYIHADRLQEKLQQILDNFDETCVKVPNLPYTESKTLPAFIIQRKFAVFNQKCRIEQVRFIVCLFPITGHPKNVETREIIQIKSDAGIHRFMNHHKLLLQSFVDNCLLKNINLVLCSEEVSDQALKLFESSGISVVHHIEDEDCEWIMSSLKLSPCVSIFENFNENMFHTADSCIPLIINGRQCVHLQLKTNLNLPKTLIVCAPTEGLCDQVVSNLKRSLKSLIMCFDFGNLWNSTEGYIESTGKVAVIGGGGTFEFLVSEFLLNYDSQDNCSGVKIICKVLSKALLQLPKTLFKNNSCSKEMNLKQFLDFIEEINKQKDSKILGFNRNGQVSDLFLEGILEPVALKVHILLSVIELLQQVLRVDSIVGVRKKIESD